MLRGNKPTSENFLLTNFKFLQKENKKNYINILKLAIVNSTPVISVRRLRKKNRKSIKEFPYVLTNKNRISLAMQYIIFKTDKTQLFKKIIFLAQKKTDFLKETKLEQKVNLAKKKYLFFRWFF